MLIFRAPTSTPTRAKPARLLKDVTSHEIADASEERREEEGGTDGGGGFDRGKREREEIPFESARW